MICMKIVTSRRILEDIITISYIEQNFYGIVELYALRNLPKTKLPISLALLLLFEFSQSS